ncbi:MAG: ThiF family adenylyltransferase [Nanoarchaeota archaeon]|nr:ThiF family adenylyltransferase [Nanoarchaeota archaeon]MBU1004490.1 ThiF family adenylyltransferase [Nanoarchaeota archaeon]MBU1945660.1 ThiF family adenylyltransferase [Nanoarchaeota archaeon]
MGVEIAPLPSINELEIRNVGAWGEDGAVKQELLHSLRVMVIGSDVLSQMVLSNLAGLGVGNICCVDGSPITGADQYNFLYFKKHGQKSLLGQKRAAFIASTLRAINPFSTITYHASGFKIDYADGFNPEVIVDATNNPSSKQACLDYCMQKPIPFVSAVSSRQRAELAVFNPDMESGALENIVQSDFVSEGHGSYTSGVISALAAEQIRKLRFSIDGSCIDRPLKTGRIVEYDPHLSLDGEPNFGDLSVLVIGAGAIGNFVALNLALLDVGNVDIIDGDKIEDHNLNRQILFYGKSGHPKSQVLSERIKEINPSLNGSFYNEYLTEDMFNVLGAGKLSYNAIFGCVDNQQARYLGNKLAVTHRIPYIDGGTSTTGGRVVAYIPGKNRCVDCQFDLGQYRLLTPMRGQGCAQNPDPSIIVPNMLIGSAMVAEFVNILFGASHLEERAFKYDTYSRDKIYFQPIGVFGQCGLGCF